MQSLMCQSFQSKFKDRGEEEEYNARKCSLATILDIDDIERQRRLNGNPNKVWVEPTQKVGKMQREKPTQMQLTGIFKQVGAALTNKMAGAAGAKAQGRAVKVGRVRKD
jgi:hypothetical protein